METATKPVNATKSFHFKQRCPAAHGQNLSLFHLPMIPKDCESAVPICDHSQVSNGTGPYFSGSHVQPFTSLGVSINGPQSPRLLWFSELVVDYESLICAAACSLPALPPTITLFARVLVGILS